MNGSVRKRGSKWYYRYYEYENGVRKQIERIGGSTKSETLKKLNQELNRIYAGIARPEEILLCDYLHDWLEDYIKDEKSDNTYYKYKCAVETKINKSIGNIRLCDLKPIHIEKYIKFLKGLKLSKTSIQFNFGVLNTALNKALKLQMIINNPCNYVDTPKREKYKANILTLDELKLIYNSLNENIYEDYIMRLALDTALELGIRRGEMCGICTDVIDFDSNKIKIDKAFIRVENKYVISRLKTEGSYRELPISNTLCEKYKNHIKLQQKNKLKYGPFYEKNTFNNQDYSLIFTWENGKAITPSNFLQRLKRLCKSHGINKNIRWHDLRHTNATLLLEGGVDMKTLQERLGHSLMQTTSDIYSHVTDKMNKHATDVISNIMDNIL